MASVIKSFEFDLFLTTAPVDEVGQYLAASRDEDPDLNQYMRRWRQFECDKIQADIYRAQERR